MGVGGWGFRYWGLWFGFSGCGWMFGCHQKFSVAHIEDGEILNMVQVRV